MTKSVGELVRVNAIDHDGCFGLQHMEPREMGTMHKPIIESLNHQKENQGYAVDYVTSSSNRQSIRLDCLNSIYNQNNLAFPVAKALAKSLGAWFDPLLLADITANRKPGFTINCINEVAQAKKLNLFENRVSNEVIDALLQENHADFTFSEDKINIIYPQMHRIALFHPQAKIHFNVYDDLLKQVLEPLNRFYSDYPDLIPANTTLNLYYYNTVNNDSMSHELNMPNLIHTIHGTGSIDSHYYHTVRQMEEIAKNEEGETSKYYMSQYITPELLQKNFNPQVSS
ncbi:hypothetical protein [Legionella santicrucis]|nr:hypothetical protein [Legionella santicrucis]